MLVLVILMMVMLLGFSAISVDVIRLFMIRNELQNAADAAALTGANYFYPTLSTGKPNWTQASTKATAMAKLNYVDNVLISDVTVQTGYWNMKGNPATLQATTITPDDDELTAVKVSISKAAGKNGGPVQLFFGPIIGLQTVDVGATAIAVSGGPASYRIGKIFPIAIADNYIDNYWNESTNSPKLSGGKAIAFKVGGEDTDSGNWTVFNVNTSSSTVLRDFVINRSPVEYEVGDTTWINPGVKQSIVYSAVPVNVDVICPIVPHVTLVWNKPILGFCVIHIDSVVNGSGNNKYLNVRMVASYKTNERPGTPKNSHGIYTPSRLVN